MLRFQRTLLAEGVTNQAEQRQRNQLNTEEQRRQMIRTGQQNAAQGGDQHQQVELFFVVLVTLKPTGRRKYRSRGSPAAPDRCKAWRSRQRGSAA